MERAFGGAFVVVALALALTGEWGGASLVAVAGATLAFVVSARVEFDISGGFIAPTQLAFVPLLFVAPATHVPLIVGVGWVCARVPDLLRGTTSLARLWVAFGNGWYSLGPALVLIVAGAHDAAEAGPWVLLIALAAQFVVDVIASALREASLRGPSLLVQIGELRDVLAIDAALVPVGLIVGLAAAEYPWAPVALIPLLGVLAVFASERRKRVRSLAELSNAYRGTAYVLGDVVEADDAYTGEHCRGVVQLAMEVGSGSASRPNGCATSSSARCCTTWARSRSRTRSSTSPASSTRTSGRSSRPTRPRARRCWTASAGS